MITVIAFITMLMKKSLLGFFITLCGIFVSCVLYIFSQRKQQQQEQPIGLLPILAPNPISEVRSTDRFVCKHVWIFVKG